MALVFLCNQGGWLGDAGLPLFCLLVMLLPRFLSLVLVSCPFLTPSPCFFPLETHKCDAVKHFAPICSMFVSQRTIYKMSQTQSASNYYSKWGEINISKHQSVVSSNYHSEAFMANILYFLKLDSCILNGFLLLPVCEAVGCTCPFNQRSRESRCAIVSEVVSWYFPQEETPHLTPPPTILCTF